jgi:hypothetical protein
MTAPVFGDLTPSIAEQLPEAVRMAMGATVFRMRIELIFRRCWNLVTPPAVKYGQYRISYGSQTRGGARSRVWACQQSHAHIDGDKSPPGWSRRSPDGAGALLP